MAIIKVLIKDWDQYQYRMDVKRASWFRLENSIFEDTLLFDLGPSEMAVWIYILCQASKQNSQEIVINSNHSSVVARIPEVMLTSTLKKLNEIGILEFSRNVRDTSTPVRDTCAIRARDRTGSTGQDKTRQTYDQSGFKISTKELEAMYEKYPRKRGKKTGLSRLSKIINSPQVLEKFNSALENFAAYHRARKTEPRFVPHFSTFVASQWEDFADGIPHESGFDKTPVARPLNEEVV